MLRLQSVIVGNSRKKLRTASHNICTIRSREYECSHVRLLECVQLSFSTLTQFKVPCLGNSTAHEGLDLLPMSTSLKTVSQRPPIGQPKVNSPD